MVEYLIAFNEEWVPEQTADELREKGTSARAVLDEMRAAGVFLFSNGGIDASTAVCSVEARDGEPVFTDGPYVETKEHLGGFCVVDVPDDDAARYWAGRLAVVLEWPQEVHRFPSSERHRHSNHEE
ncbi:YciI family protein [Stackebrandtia soli]|uniref:YciI family protein n=1 Tax=Stackebrandtia soli TaxID=1892856 RepID=UPI0039EC38E1